MQSILRNQQAFNAVATGQTANVSVPVGGIVYEAFFINHKHGAIPANATRAELVTNIERVQVKLDGNPLIDLTGAELLDLNDYYGYPFANGYLAIPFTRPEFLDAREDLRFALGTADLGQVTVEVTLAAGLISPSLSLHSRISHGVTRKMGQVIRIRRTSFGSQVAAGVREIHDLPVTGPETGRGVKAIHIKAANIFSHEIIRQALTISEGEVELVNLNSDFCSFQTVGRTPQAGYHHIDFGGNRTTGIISTEGVSDFRLKLTFSAAVAAFPIITEETIGVADF